MNDAGLECREVAFAPRDLAEGQPPILDGVNASFAKGALTLITGPMGAGKSTLVKILAGVLMPDQGEIYFEGKPVRFSSPKDARAVGIDTVEQNLSLINIMNISRNFFLGREPFFVVILRA